MKPESHCCILVPGADGFAQQNVRHLTDGIANHCKFTTVTCESKQKKHRGQSEAARQALKQSGI